MWCIDLSAGADKSLGRPPLPAQLARGVSSCTTRHPRDMLQCLGGVTALLPLVAMLDQPTRPSTPTTPIDYGAKPTRAVAVLSLLCELMRDNVAEQQRLVRVRFALVLRFLLRRVSPGLLDADTLTAVHHLIDVAS